MGESGPAPATPGRREPLAASAAPHAGNRGSFPDPPFFHTMENIFAVFPHNGKKFSTLWKTFGLPHSRGCPVGPGDDRAAVWGRDAPVPGLPILNPDSQPPIGHYDGLDYSTPISTPAVGTAPLFGAGRVFLADIA